MDVVTLRVHLRADDEETDKMEFDVYCIMCQTYGHIPSEKCVVWAVCFNCGVTGHVRKDCNEGRRQITNIKEEEIKRECITKEENKQENIKKEDMKEENLKIKEIKRESIKMLEIKLESSKCDNEYMEAEVPKDEPKNDALELESEIEKDILKDGEIISYENEDLEVEIPKAEPKNDEKNVKVEAYCNLCQIHGHILSEACVVNVICFVCGIKGHVRKDCKEEKCEFKNVKSEVKNEDIKYEEEYIEKEIKKDETKCVEVQKMSTKIFIGSIPYCSTGHSLWQFFSKFGQVVDALVVRDKRTRKSKGFGFVRFSDEDEAKRALEANKDELTMKGRVLNTGRAKLKKPRDLFGEVKLGSPSKTKKLKSHNDITPKDDENAPIKTRFVDLNDDVREMIFSHLSLSDLCRISRVSKQWKAIMTSVWKQKKKLDFFDFPLTLSDKVLSRILSKTQKGLTSLNLSQNSSRLSYFALEMVGELCPNLKRVDISGLVVTKPSIKKFAQFCPNVEVVTAVNCERFNAKSAWELLHSLPKLQALDLSKNAKLTGKCFSFAPATITRLNLTDCKALLPAGVSFAVQYCPSLSHLSLGGCSSLDGTVVEALLFSTLTSLQMNGRYPRMTNASEFAKIGNIPTLKNLNVSFNDLVCDDLLANLSSVATLISLDVSGCNGRVRNNSGVTDAGVRNLKNIVHLDISYLSGVSDRALRHLSTLKSLKTVQVCGSPEVTNNGFGAMVTLASLTRLDVSGCRGVNSLFCGALLVHRPKFSEHLDLFLGGTEGSEGEVDHIKSVNIDNVTIHLVNNCMENLRPGNWNRFPDYGDYEFDSDGGYDGYWSDSYNAGSEHEDEAGEIDEAIALPMDISDAENDVNNPENDNNDPESDVNSPENDVNDPEIVIMQPVQSNGNVEEADNEHATETTKDINKERGENFEESVFNETAGTGEEAESQ